VVLDLHRQPLLTWIERRPLRHRPRWHRIADLEPEVVMQGGRTMLLDHEAPARCRARRPRRRLRRAREVALPLVLGQAGACRGLLRWHDPSSLRRRSVQYKHGCTPEAITRRALDGEGHLLWDSRYRSRYGPAVFNKAIARPDCRNLQIQGLLVVLAGLRARRV